jgi:nitrate/TMAO reductase-like tetraheme cytochrome c subunit
MKKVFLVMVLSFFILGISQLTAYADNVIKGALPEKLPPKEKCADCHDINHIYKELTESKHKELKCFDCHVPGRVQTLQYSEKEISFYRLGYHQTEGNWLEASGNGACLRCHGDEKRKAMSGECWSCHMNKSGEDSVIIVKDKQKPRTPDNIKEIKKYPHMSHNFKMH